MSYANLLDRYNSSLYGRLGAIALALLHLDLIPWWRVVDRNRLFDN